MRPRPAQLLIFAPAGLPFEHRRGVGESIYKFWFSENTFIPIGSGAREEFDGTMTVAPRRVALEHTVLLFR